MRKNILVGKYEHLKETEVAVRRTSCIAVPAKRVAIFEIPPLRSEHCISTFLFRL